MNYASYLEKFFDPCDRRRTVNKIRKAIKDKSIKYDGFVVTGVSGISNGTFAKERLGDYKKKSQEYSFI
jgi:hypothetical protein